MAFRITEGHIILLRKFLKLPEIIVLEDSFDDFDDALERNDLANEEVEITNEHKFLIVVRLVRFILASPDIWEQSCQLSLKQFFREVEKLHHRNLAEIDRLLLFTYKCTLEFKLTVSEGVSEVLGGLLFLMEKRTQFLLDEQHVESLNFFKTGLQIQVYKKIVNPQVLESISTISDVKEESLGIKKEIFSKIESWDKSLVERENKIQAMEERLRKHESGFNFVALTAAFEKLNERKRGDLFWAKVRTTTWMIAAFFGPVAYILLLLNIKNLELIEWFYFLPSVTLLALALYFFRIALLDKMSIDTQLSQLDFRQSLCQFIESYAEYSTKIGEKNPDSLKRFEELIFSNIVLTDDKIPATFDGVEQFGKVIANFRPK